MKLGIIGNGFVGSAVEYGFSVDTEQFIVDPKFNDNTLQDLVNRNAEITFVCVPTPQQDTHMDVDTSIARTVLQELNELEYKGVVVVKSTITPHHLKQFKTLYSNLRLVYNPEFLTEANSKQEFINPHMQILGGELQDCIEVEQAYINHSKVKIVPTFKTDLTSASMIKYTINSWLATKVSFFNELFHLHQSSNAETSWEQFTDMLKRDPRVGDSHMQVPGPDGQFGFGGHCLPKDTKALLYYSKLEGAPLSLLEQVINQNSNQRSG
jgi:UDPglucose 6-dehydrogenase